MQRFKRILTIVDDMHSGGPALDRAIALARRNAARLTIAACMEPIVLAGATPADDLEQMLRAHYLEFLAGIAERNRDGKLPIATRLLEGIPFLEIIREVMRGPHDLVVKVAEGDARGESLFGSTDLHLLRKCPCPVLLLRPADSRPFQRVLAAVDPVGDDPAAAELSATIMTLAGALAASDGATLDVLHCWDLGEQRARRRHLATRLAALAATEEEAHRQRLAELVARFERRDTPIQTHLLHGDPRTAIVDFAAANSVDAIVLGTTSRGHIPGFLIGGTAEEVVSQVRSAVLAVKPPAFLTPVEAAAR